MKQWAITTDGDTFAVRGETLQDAIITQAHAWGLVRVTGLARNTQNDYLLLEDNRNSGSIIIPADGIKEIDELTAFALDVAILTGEQPTAPVKINNTGSDYQAEITTSHGVAYINREGPELYRVDAPYHSDRKPKFDPRRPISSLIWTKRYSTLAECFDAIRHLA
jgi:hypothetical protein